MMGPRGGGQGQLFYAFNLEAHVPQDHLLRGIDRFVDLSELRERLAPFYSHTGRPSIDPELMIRMLIVGYCFGIRSERRLCEEVHLNLAYRWFCRLGLEDKIPDHSSFSKNRHGRFRDRDTLRHVFEQVLRRAMSEGLVGGEGFAVDASVVRVDANRSLGVPGEQATCWRSGEGAPWAVREYLAALEQANPAEPAPKSISLTGPAARYTAAPGGPAFYAYSTNYLVDVEAGIIVDVEASPALRSDEVSATRTMIDRVEQRLELKPTRLIGDTAYGTAEVLGWMVNDKGIEPHVPVWDKTERQDEPVERRVPVGRTGRPVPLPAGPRAAQAVACVQKHAHAHHQGQHHHLPLEPIGLRGLPDESALPSEHADSQDRSQRPRSGAAGGSWHRPYRRLSAIAQTAQDGRDPLRAPQTHLEARSTATAWAERRKRRVSIGCNRSKPTTNGEMARA
jgi:transposase